MKSRVYPKINALMVIFIEAIADYEGFKFVKQDPICLFTFDSNSYYAYFKFISHEGRPHPLEHQRAQLPRHSRFCEVKESSFPFLFLGYDKVNDVFVCWEPHKVKPRLNKRSYVSFYSRLSTQEKVVLGKIEVETLTNGDKFILFKRADAISFLRRLDFYFPELKLGEGRESTEKTSPGCLERIEDDEAVQRFIDSYPIGTSSLKIVGDCITQFSGHYSELQFGDWSRLIKSYLAHKSY